MKKLFFSKVIAPYLKKNPLACTQTMRDAVVYQMSAAGIPWSQINKWLLKVTGEKITGYVFLPGKGIMVFYEWPSMDKQRELGIVGKVKHII